MAIWGIVEKLSVAMASVTCRQCPIIEYLVHKCSVIRQIDTCGPYAIEEEDDQVRAGRDPQPESNLPTVQGHIDRARLCSILNLERRGEVVNKGVVNGSLDLRMISGLTAMSSSCSVIFCNIGGRKKAGAFMGQSEWTERRYQAFLHRC